MGVGVFNVLGWAPQARAAGPGPPGTGAANVIALVGPRRGPRDSGSPPPCDSRPECANAMVCL